MAPAGCAMEARGRYDMPRLLAQLQHWTRLPRMGWSYCKGYKLLTTWVRRWLTGVSNEWRAVTPLSFATTFDPGGRH